MNRKFYYVLAFLMIATISLHAQSETFIHISGQGGMVLNSQKDRKLGLGGTVALLQQDAFLARSKKTYFTFSLKAFNNPYGEGKFIGSLFNKKNDGFNYFALLGGYRVTSHGIETGFFVEPRVGVGFFANSARSFLCSTVIGYAFNHVNLAVYGDWGTKRNHNFAMGKTNFMNIGLSVGYNIAL